MAKASLILGIAALFASLLPSACWFAYLPAITALALAICALQKLPENKKGKWVALPGLVFSSTTIIWVPFFVFAIQSGALPLDEVFNLSLIESLGTSESSTWSGTASGGSGDSSSGFLDGMDFSFRRRDPKLKPLSEELNRLNKRIDELPFEEMQNELKRIRQSAAEIENLSDRERLLKNIGSTASEATVVEAGKLYVKASQLYKEDRLDSAAKLCRQVVDLFKERGFEAAQRPRPLSAAEELLGTIEIARDPTKRFEVKGFMSVGDNSMVRVYDTSKRETVTLEEGDEIAGFKIEKIDQTAKMVVLTNGDDSYSLYSSR